MPSDYEGRILFALVVGALCLIDAAVLAGRYAHERCWIQTPDFTGSVRSMFAPHGSPTPLTESP